MQNQDNQGQQTTRTEVQKLLDTVEKQGQLIKILGTIVEKLNNRVAVPDKAVLALIDQYKRELSK